MSARVPSDLDKQLAAFLRAEMKRRDMSYVELGALLGISKSTCHRLISCESSATLQLLSQIRRALRVSVTEIFPGK
jgi:hypothetical protein